MKNKISSITKIKQFSRPIVDVDATAWKIRHLRIRVGLSARDVQKVLGFSSPQAVYNWEAGRDVPSVDSLVVLAEIFGVRVDDIIATRIVEVDIELDCEKEARSA